MNPEDAPHVPIATEFPYMRRLRFGVMWSKSTQCPGDVCPGSRVYIADDAPSDRLRGPDATSVFMVTFLMPFIRKSSKIECELRQMTPLAQVADDTAWMVRKMARIGKPGIPPISRDGNALAR